MLLGITGKKRRGKDSIANYLVETYGYKRHGFADKVKDYLYAINPLIITDFSIDGVPEIYSSNQRTVGFRLKSLVLKLGWEKAKEIPEIRQLLQRTGTEAGRSIFWKDFWVDVLFRQLEEKYDVYETGPLPIHKELQSNIVISDCRFDNEAERIKAYGGFVVQVDSTREGLPAPDSHASEQPINPKYVDAFVDNSGSFEELYSKIDSVIKEFKNLQHDHNRAV